MNADKHRSPKTCEEVLNHGIHGKHGNEGQETQRPPRPQRAPSAAAGLLGPLKKNAKKQSKAWVIRWQIIFIQLCFYAFFFRADACGVRRLRAPASLREIFIVGVREKLYR